MLSLNYESEMTNDRCALCGRILCDIGTFSTTVWYCRTCGIENGPYMPGYCHEQIYIDPKTRISYHYFSHGLWNTMDEDGNTGRIEEAALPGDMITADEWRAQQRAADRIVLLYGAVSQLTLLEAAP